MNIVKTLKNFFTPTYNVLYAPEEYKSGSPIKKYKVIGNPRKAAWKSKAGNRLFTLPVKNREGEFRSFRADRVLSVNFALV